MLKSLNVRYLFAALACPVANMPVFPAGLVEVSRELVVLAGL